VLFADVTSPSQQSVGELRRQAAGYRRTAKIARTIEVRHALIKIAYRYDELADEGEQEGRRSADRTAFRSGRPRPRNG
jgi:hypothetical protein